MSSSPENEKAHRYPKSLIIGLVIIVIVAGRIWLRLASPYLPFPSDDKSWYMIFNDYFASLQSQRPMFHLLLYGLKQLCQTCPDGRILITTMALSNAAVAVILGLLSFRITRSIVVGLVSAVIYVTSAWSANFYFLASYVVYASVFAMLTLLLLVEAHLSDDARQRKKYLLIAGFMTGLYFWSSTSSPVLVALFLGIVAVFIGDRQPASAQITGGGLRLAVAGLYGRFLHGNFWAYVATMTAGFGLFAFAAIPRLYTEVTLNVYSTTYHIVRAREILGFAPEKKLFSFYKVYFEYSPYLVGLFILSLLLIVLMYFRARMKNVPNNARRMIAILAAVIVLYALLIDVLPFQTIGRYQFVIYPITIVVICGVSYYLLSSFQTRIARIYAIVAMSLLTAFILASNVSRSSEVLEARKTIVNTITQYSGGLDIYILNEDPHRHHIVRALNSPELTVSIQKVDFSKFIEVVEKSKVMERTGKLTHRSALLLGPRGRDSGKSIIQHCTYPDYYPEQLAGFSQLENKAIKKITMLYYAYYPTFLMEEEVCQGLYFEGKTPVHKSDPSKDVMLMIF